MNSKAEWNNARIPRIIVEEGDRQTEDRESGLGNKTQERNRRIDRVEKNRKRGTTERETEEGEGRERKNRDSLKRGGRIAI